MSVSSASTDFKVPRKTLDDHVKGRVGSRPGPPSALTVAEESSLVTYIEYMGSRGFPMSRDFVWHYVIAIVKKSDRPTTFNLDKGPTDRWFRKFFKRHSQLKEGLPESQDRGRNRMSNQRVMDQYFTLLNDTIDKLKIKPEQIYNCDETGWSGKEKSKRRVIGMKGQHSYQQQAFTAGHITAHLCICADGRIIPSFLIFESSLPHTAYKEGVPGTWMFGYSDSGYMDSKLFLSWFEHLFIPSCGRIRPVLLIMDNHDSHITLDVVDMARKNGIELLGLPPHTTHILQPLDVHINGPLKAKVSSVATRLGHLNKHQVINTAKFPAVLSYSIDQFCSPGRIKEAFRKTGIYPLNPDAIDKTQLVESHSIAKQVPSVAGLRDDPVPRASTSSDDQVAPAPTSSDDTLLASTSSDDPVPPTSSICVTCGTFLGGNPLVTEGLIPQHLAGIFQPIPCKPQTVTSRKLVTESRVITSAEFVQQLEEKVEEDKKKKEGIVRRKREREENRMRKEAEKAEKLKNKMKKGKQSQKKRTGRKNQQESQQADHDYLCKVCDLPDPVDSNSDENTKWVGCEKCEDWVHPSCAGLADGTDLETVNFLCADCDAEE